MNPPERLPEGAPAVSPPREPAPDELEALRSILTHPERERVAQLEAQVAELDMRTQDRDALIATISPVLSDVIRQQIRDNREAMIDVLYPIIGQLIGRAVAEAIRELARTIDTADAGLIQPCGDLAALAGTPGRHPRRDVDAAGWAALQRNGDLPDPSRERSAAQASVE